MAEILTSISMTDDVLKSNNGAFITYGLVNFNVHFVIPECDKYNDKP